MPKSKRQPVHSRVELEPRLDVPDLILPQPPADSRHHLGVPAVGQEKLTDEAVVPQRLPVLVHAHPVSARPALQEVTHEPWAMTAIISCCQKPSPAGTGEGRRSQAVRVGAGGRPLPVAVLGTPARGDLAGSRRRSCRRDRRRRSAGASA